MQLKNNYFFTIKEDVKDEESVSANLLVRSGMIKKIGAGIYTYLPLGQRVLKNVENIVREEMNKSNALELLMPSLIPAEYYKESGRIEAFGNGLFQLKDRFNREMVLGPTHEELFVMAAKSSIKSYKDMPFNLYQIAKKYRDEPRPRYGLIRVREFLMKDAYSFDRDEEGLAISYRNMYDAYNRIFTRLGIDYKIVKADTGAMGGTLSEEFQAITDLGEDKLVICNNCDYASNIEVAQSTFVKKELDKELTSELVHTPNIKTIEELCTHFNIESTNFVKALVYKADNELVMVLLRGDHSANELKIQKYLNCKTLELANEEDLLTINTVLGYVGPIDINVKIIADNEVSNMSNFVVGANKHDYHIKNANLSAFKDVLYTDLREVTEFDVCPKCGSKLEFKRGIEIGNTFKLDTKYSELLNLTYTDQFNKLNNVYMGCYGIGIERTLAAIVEQTSDESGLILPMEIAPFKVGIIIINETDSDQMEYADLLYTELKKRNIEVIMDDRSERAGVKFKDMDLIGIPLQITIGKKIKEGIVEFKLRKTGVSIDLKLEDVVESILKEV